MLVLLLFVVKCLTFVYSGLFLGRFYYSNSLNSPFLNRWFAESEESCDGLRRCGQCDTWHCDLGQSGVDCGMTDLRQEGIQERLCRAPKWLPWLLFGVLGFAIYAVSLNGPPQFDDNGVFAQHTTAQMFSRCTVPRRCFANLTFALNHAVHGQEVLGYHVVNVLCHILVALGVFYLVLAIPGDKRYRRMLAWTAGLLFLVHPMATQAVSYIAQRYSSLSALLVIWALVFYCRTRNRMGEGRAFVRPLVLCGVFAVLAALSKEYVVIMPVLAILIELLFYRPVGNAWKQRLLALTPLLLAVVVLGASLMLSVPQKAEAAPVKAKGVSVSDWTAGRVPRAEYLRTQMKIIPFTYFRLIVVPWGQSVDHEFEPARKVELKVLAGIAVLVAMLVLAGVIWNRAPWVAFGLLLMIVNMLPTSSLVPNTEFVSEHRAYLSIAGWTLVLGALLVRLPWRLWLGSGIVLLGVFIPLTVRRNLMWTDELALWMNAYRQWPDGPRPVHGVATAYLHRGEYELAIEFFRKALEVRPNYMPTYTNLTLALEENGQLDEALRVAQAYLRRWPDGVKALSNSARISLKLDDLAAAESYVQRALEQSPGHVPSLFTLGQLRDKQGRHAEAIAVYEALLERSLSPDQRAAARFLLLRAQKEAK